MDFFYSLQVISDIRVKAEHLENNQAIDCCLYLESWLIESRKTEGEEHKLY